MKVSIISDIHDNIENLSKALGAISQEKCEQMICCGDVTNSETLDLLAGKFNGNIHIVEGNIELYSLADVEKHNNITHYGKIGHFKISGIKVAICHEPFRIGQIYKLGAPDIIFYGHTHKPWEKEQDGCRIINPGNVAGVLHAPSFAVWDTRTNELKLYLINQL